MIARQSVGHFYWLRVPIREERQPTLSASRVDSDHQNTLVKY